MKKRDRYRIMAVIIALCLAMTFIGCVSVTVEVEPKNDEVNITEEADAADNEAAEADEADEADDAVAGEENLGPFEVPVVDGKIVMPTFGMTLTIPQAWKDAGVEIKAVGFVDPAYAFANIVVVDPDDPDNNDLSIAYIEGQRTPVNKEDIADDEDIPRDSVIIMGDNKTLYYYSLDYDTVIKSDPQSFDKPFEEMGITSEQIKMLKELWTNTKDLIAGAEITDLTLPPEPKAEDISNSDFMSYTAQDIDGNDVKMGDIIGGNKVTMINVWGTFCGPCISEIPDLAGFYDKYKDQGFGIIGLTVDVLDDSDEPIDDFIEDAKDIVSSSGVDYPILRETKALKDVFVTSAYPTTYFVDKDGKIIGDTILGSRPADDWERIILEKLSAAE